MAWNDSFGATPGALSPNAAQPLGAFANGVQIATPKGKAPVDTREMGKNIASILPKEREDKTLEPRDPLPPIDKTTGVGYQDPAWRKDTGSANASLIVTSKISEDAATKTALYNVDVYKNGIRNAKTSTGVFRQLQVKAGQTIPNGSKITGFYVKSTGEWEAQFPIFLRPPT